MSLLEKLKNFDKGKYYLGGKTPVKIKDDPRLGMPSSALGPDDWKSLIETGDGASETPAVPVKKSP